MLFTQVPKQIDDDETGKIDIIYNRIGKLPANARFGITTEELKRFRDNIQNKSEGS